MTRQPPPPDFEWTSESIRALRSHLGQSQAALARELGIRQQTVSEWETGMYKPRGASVTILTLLAVSSGFQFDLPEARDSAAGTGPQRQRAGDSSSRQSARTSSRPAPREIKGPRTHPDWVRTSAVSTDAASTRNYNREPRAQFRFKDGEIPM